MAGLMRRLTPANIARAEATFQHLTTGEAGYDCLHIVVRRIVNSVAEKLSLEPLSPWRDVSTASLARKRRVAEDSPGVRRKAFDSHALARPTRSEPGPTRDLQRIK